MYAPSMSIFEIFAVKNTPTYIASKELLLNIKESVENNEPTENVVEEAKQDTDSN